MADMLETAKGGVLKTRIMYGANLSYAQLDEYLSLLLKRGLLKNVNKNGQAFYKTTAKGLRYIQSHNKISAFLIKKETKH